jgi:nitrite reductase/ring-hydroxylating ferredoxin subunit
VTAPAVDAHAGRWHEVARLTDVGDGEPYPITVDDTAIALYRVAGTIHAVSDICTHEYVRLSDGALDGAAITCPLHHARFDVTTGRCLARPADRDLATYPVRVDGATVLIKL